MKQQRGTMSNGDSDFDPETQIAYDDDNGTEHIAPRAVSFIQIKCGDPECELIHVISLTEDDKPICETTFTKEQLKELLHQPMRDGHDE